MFLTLISQPVYSSYRTCFTQTSFLFLPFHLRVCSYSEACTLDQIFSEMENNMKTSILLVQPKTNGGTKRGSVSCGPKATSGPCADGICSDTDK